MFCHTKPNVTQTNFYKLHPKLHPYQHEVDVSNERHGPCQLSQPARLPVTVLSVCGLGLSMRFHSSCSGRTRADTHRPAPQARRFQLRVDASSARAHAPPLRRYKQSCTNPVVAVVDRSSIHGCHGWQCLANIFTKRPTTTRCTAPWPS